jgi:hypothetical protein
MMANSDSRHDSGFVELAEHVRSITDEAYPARVVLQSTCACRGTLFHVKADEAEGCAQRTCVACGTAAFIGDSDEYWADAEPASVLCDCGGDAFEVAVGFSFRSDEEVRWIIVGVRCAACGAVSSPVDWKIDYAPTDHLFERA